jgi:cellulose synthase/poly-beta-1,6-N-acetylglucosamine synthase-like glycosyltransferase
MNVLQIVFWVCAAGVLYAYVGYPLLLLCLARLRPRPVRRAETAAGSPPSPLPSVSVVIAAYNEEHRIASRREEFTAVFAANGIDGEIVIVSDGSTDATVAAAHRGAGPRVRVIELAQNVGKAEALSRGVAAAGGELVVFADTRQRWAPDALRRLLENFEDPAVGGVSGDLVLEASGGATSGVGLYWRYEKAVRKLESCVHSTVGVTGAISAVRRTLFRPIPPRTILDDVYWPMRVVMQGFRVVHDDRANAFDRLPDRARDEWRRKVRTLSGNFQLAAREPDLLLPWRNPVWLQFLSHKLLRMAVPWMLVGLLAVSALLGGPAYGTAAAIQGFCYLLALAGLHPAVGRRFRPASSAAAFLLLNAAGWVAFWVWAGGRAGSSWKKVSYRPGAPAITPVNADLT